jgi:hypothetical protein
MKTKAVVYAFLLSLCFLNTGCFSHIAAQNDAAMESWVGHSEGELIAAWGPPPFVRDDGRGGKVLVYGGIYQHQFQRMFYVNPSGIIYSWRWQN